MGMIIIKNSKEYEEKTEKLLIIGELDYILKRKKYIFVSYTFSHDIIYPNEYIVFISSQILF